MTYEDWIVFHDPKYFVDQTGINYRDCGDYLHMNCPYHDDSKPSAALYLDTGVFKCFSGSCGIVKSFFNFIKDQGVAITQEDEEEVNNLYLVRQSRNRVVRNIGIKKMLFDNLTSNEEIDKYLQERGGTLKTKEFFNPLFNDATQRVHFPIFNSAMDQIGWEMRSILPNPRIKVLYEKGCSVNNHIYWHRSLDTTKRLHLTEGLMDMVPLIERNEQNISCTYGALVTKNQLKEINLFPEIYLYMDGDKAGVKWYDLIEEVAGDKIKQVYFWKNEDPNSIWKKGFWDTYEIKRYEKPEWDYHKLEI